MREFCKASPFLSSVAAFGQSQGRFYFIFAVPISSVVYQVWNDFLFNGIRLFPYLVAVTGVVFFLSALVKDFPRVLALALCLTLTPIWRGWGPVLSYPWWMSLGFAAFAWSAVAWLKWSETKKKAGR